MSKPIDEILTPKPVVRPRIYAYSINDQAHKGLLKVGQTTRNVKQRVAEQLKTATIKNYKIELDESAERDDGAIFTDHDVRAALVRKKFANTELEWMRCSLQNLKTVLTELRTGQRFTGTHHQTFQMRREQAEAVDKTFDYFHSIWSEDQNAVPRFLWNAKMRFGKTFTAYQLAKKLGAKRVLVLTFKPAVEDAWQTDLEFHIDFEGWHYLSRNSDSDPTKIDDDKPVVYFGSFQDLLGRDAAGNIKSKNEWLHTLNWDLVVFDEYHFGAWRETAKELFEGEEETVAKKEIKQYADLLEDVNEDLGELSEKETEFLPITTKAYLYLSGTPFKALATGEFIEEQIFNWTYTDEQRAKQDFAAENPGKWNPYGALPQMRLLTYQMPDELLTVASAGLSLSTRATYKSGWILSGASTHRRLWTASRQARRHRFLIRTCGFCPTSSTRSGFCLTSPPAMQWRICLPKSIIPSGMITSSLWLPGHRRESDLMLSRRSARLLGAVSSPRPSRSRAASSPRA
jgi:hypothetical protein